MSVTETRNQAAAARSIAVKRLIAENQNRYLEIHREERVMRDLPADPSNLRIPSDKLDDAIAKTEEKLAKLKARKQELNA